MEKIICSLIILFVSGTIFADTISNLKQDIRRSGKATLERFWKKALEQGLPIVEDIPNDPDHKLVTFMVRSSTQKIVVSFCQLSQSEKRDGEMKRLLGTNLWYKQCRLPNDTRLTYCFAPAFKKVDNWKRDRANPRKMMFGKGQMCGNRKKLTMSILELPSALSQKWVKNDVNAPRGALKKIIFKSKLLKNKRPVWIYTPPDYPLCKECNLLVLLDGDVYHGLIPTPLILDNLIRQKKIPPVVAVMIGCIDSPTRNKEMSCDLSFVSFLAVELIPWIHKNYIVHKNPQNTAIGGYSYGGRTATFCGLKAPHIFGNVLSQSGVFGRHDERKKITHWFNVGPSKKVKNSGLKDFAFLAAASSVSKFPPSNQYPKFYMNVGRLEVYRQDNLVSDNLKMKANLEKCGYQVHYSEFSGGHDYIAWQDTLATGLMALFGRAHMHP